jgi:hypothetical protein
MNKNHHALTLEASTQLLQSWSGTGGTARYAKAAKQNSNAAQVKQMRRWVVQPDELDDVYVPDVVVDAIIDKVSRATSFQHFAYCGSLGPLKAGNITVNKFDGYAWDCDPFLAWYESLANVSWADVKYKPDPQVAPEIMDGHPASKVIRGDQDWDDQKYPSALELADFYGSRALSLQKNGNAGYALQSACFAIHLLHDMTIPQHVLCTIEHGHSDYENKAETFWQAIFSGRSEAHQQSTFDGQMSADVLAGLAELDKATSFRQIGEFAIDRTMTTLISNRKDVAPPCKNDTYRLTTLGIICTIKALELLAAV